MASKSLGPFHILTQRPKGSGKHREGKIVARELVVSSGDATKVFDAIEEAFDDVPSAV
jgi:hypothetical protein